MKTESVHKYLTTLPSTTWLASRPQGSNRIGRYNKNLIRAWAYTAAMLVVAPLVLQEVRYICSKHMLHGGIGVATCTYGAVIPPVKSAEDDDFFGDPSWNKLSSFCGLSCSSLQADLIAMTNIVITLFSFTFCPINCNDDIVIPLFSAFTFCPINVPSYLHYPRSYRLLTNSCR